MTPPLAHRDRETSIATLVRTERAAGRDVVIVPAGTDKAETLTLFREILRFPSWFGLNYDALHDCLRTWAHEQPRPWTLIWDGAAGVHSTDPRTYAVITDLLGQLAADDGRVFVVDR